MDNLGTFNLFTSHFVIGCKETYLQHTQTITYEIEALHKWMNYKDSDYGMNKYRTERTQYISFLRIIDFNIFQSIVKDLYKIYSVKYKYSDASDFVKNVFDYTIYDLQRIIDLDLIPIGCSPNENKYVFYLLDSDREFIDFAIDSDFDIGYYKQYYKKVVEVSDLLEQLAPEQDKQKGKDIADYLIKQDWKLYRKQEVKPLPMPEPVFVEIPKSEKSEALKTTLFLEPKQLPKVEVLNPEPVINWDSEIKKLEDFFKSVKLPKEPIKLNSSATIKNNKDFITNHLAIVKANNGRKTFEPYLNRLKSLKYKLHKINN